MSSRQSPVFGTLPADKVQFSADKIHCFSRQSPIFSRQNPLFQPTKSSFLADKIMFFGPDSADKVHFFSRQNPLLADKVQLTYSQIPWWWCACWRGWRDCDDPGEDAGGGAGVVEQEDPVEAVDVGAGGGAGVVEQEDPVDAVDHGVEQEDPSTISASWDHNFGILGPQFRKDPTQVWQSYLQEEEVPSELILTNNLSGFERYLGVWFRDQHIRGHHLLLPVFLDLDLWASFSFFLCCFFLFLYATEAILTLSLSFSRFLFL